MNLADLQAVSGREGLSDVAPRGMEVSSIDDTGESARRVFRILMYCTYFPPEYSGAALQAITLAKALRQRGHHIEFITERWHDEPALDIHEGFTVHRISGGRQVRHAEFLLWFQLARFCWKQRRDFDIIHSHGAYYRQSIVGLIARLMGMGSLVKASLANNDLKPSDSAFVTSLHRWMLRRIDAYVAISRQLETEFLDIGMSACKLHLLPNGVDTDRFRPVTVDERARIRNRLGLPVEGRLALYVGVFDARKNVEWLARTWIREGAFGLDMPLVAVGPQSRDRGDAHIKLRLAALAAHAPNCLRVIDSQSEIHEYFQASDLLVLPSIEEGMPNCVLEAMATGLPCVVPWSDWNEGLISEGQTGARFRYGDAVSLAKALRVAAALNNRADIIRSRAISGYAITALYDRYLDLYQDIIQRCQKHP